MSQTNEGKIASIRQKLFNLSKDRNEDFQFLLTKYGLERFLYRISQSKYRNQFILKGALLFLVWEGEAYRQTRDMDLLGFGQNTANNLNSIFQELCLIEVEPDGIEFDSDSITVTEIREEQEYSGQRIKLSGFLGKAKISLQIDVGFGDAVTPEAEESDYPTLLEMPQPRIRIYPPETVVAEKLQAMVELGMQNSRMKDFFDIYTISQQFNFKGDILVEAIRNTFERRSTDIPEDLPLALTDEFASNNQKQIQWKAFLNKSGLNDTSIDLAEIVSGIRIFLKDPLKAAEQRNAFDLNWNGFGDWKWRK